MQNSVCIVGVGAFTSIGLSGPATAAAARAGIANFNEHPYMIDREGEPYILAMVPTLATQLMGVERYVHLAIPAIQEALTPLADLEDGVGTIQVKIGLPEERPGFPEDVQSKFSEEVKKHNLERYQLEDIELIGKGHAAGLMLLKLQAGKYRKGALSFAWSVVWIAISIQIHSIGLKKMSRSICHPMPGDLFRVKQLHFVFSVHRVQLNRLVYQYERS